MGETIVNAAFWALFMISVFKKKLFKCFLNKAVLNIIYLYHKVIGKQLNTRLLLRFLEKKDVKYIIYYNQI